MTTLKLPGLDYDTAALEDFCKRWGVIKLAFFGAAGRNELMPHDVVDVLVALPADSRVSGWDLTTMEDELSDILGRAASLMDDGPIANPYRAAEIRHDSTVVYAA
jgi:predicted nucleotidyltransferase